ncbi:M56 family metallopeptidase, partial [Staphylococcus aureus]|uniref:M56 family metallopeptidase n=1 Tax=Staphylococcus aureus TaxID=1280 RepID=UPI00301D93D0
KLLITSVVSFCFIFLLLVFFKYILKRYFNYSLNYKVWYLTVLAGLIPFIPIKFSFIKLNNVNNQAPTVESKSHDLNHNINTTKPVQEFTTDIHKFNWDSIDNICTVVWIVLVIILSFKFLKSLLYLKYLKKQSLYLNEKEKDKINKILFNHQYKRNIVIRKAESIHSPITFWYGKYIILIPSSYFKSVIDKRLKYIILHEYAHAKNRDTLHLIIFNIFSIVMSYNPLIHIVKRKIIHDNEVEADRFVLNNINKNEFKTYAESIMDSVLNIPFFNKN